MTRLPRELELKFREELVKLEGTISMNTTDSIPSIIEVWAREEGRQEGRQQGLEQAGRQAILEALETRFGAIPENARTKVQNLTGEAQLKAALRLAITAPSVAAFLEQV